MGRTSHFYSLVAATLFIVSSGNSVAATLKGRLVVSSPQNYKVVAINKNGSSKLASVASSGKFAIATKKGTTLQLVDSAGRYKGPIVLGKGSRALPTLSGRSGDAGKVKVRTGFASAVNNSRVRKLFEPRPSVSFNTARGPRGANKFGFVRVASSALAARASAIQIGQDSDLDGVPDLLDIDDDGDLKLDIVDEVQHSDSAFESEMYSTLRLDLVDSLNVNAAGISDTLIDEFVKEHLIVQINLRNNGTKTVSAVDVNCQGLSYCAQDTGTATIRMDNGPLAEDAFWSGYDPDSDGLPNLQLKETGPVTANIGIRPHAAPSELRTGDLLLLNVKTSDNATQTVPTIVPFVFNTGPALKEYTSGDSTVAVTYPVTAGSAGTSGLAPFVLPNGTVRLTFWKPQRKNIEGAEPGGYYDLGGLRYGASLSVGSSVYTCNADEFGALA